MQGKPRKSKVALENTQTASYDAQLDGAGRRDRRPSLDSADVKVEV